jgi:hypothetical protein
MGRCRMTNKKIISILLPVLRKVLAEATPDGEVGELGDIGWLKVERIDEGELVYVAVTLHFYEGKYGRATLATKVRKSDNTPLEWLGYEKTFRGAMNGYFASVDWSGRILGSEWD